MLINVCLDMIRVRRPSIAVRRTLLSSKVGMDGTARKLPRL